MTGTWFQHRADIRWEWQIPVDPATIPASINFQLRFRPDVDSSVPRSYTCDRIIVISSVFPSCDFMR